MIKSTVSLMTLLPLFQCIVQELTPHPSCGKDPVSARTLRVSVNSRRNQSGDWVDTFAARTESGSSSDRVDFDLTHTIFECEGKRVIYIQGVSNANSVGISADRLTFHPRCGNNVAIINKGRSVQKIRNDGSYIHSMVFTNRQLGNNEIFEVKIDKKNPKGSASIGIGVIFKTANEIDVLPEMYKSPFLRMYYGTGIYSNGVEIVENYGKDLIQLQVGDTVGVMRSEFGTLNIFVNGVDRGPAASNIPSPVYGIFDLSNHAIIANIVDASSPPS